MFQELANSVFAQKIVLVTVITILPLIPSYILFKFLPAKSIVTGPFKGMNIDFSGATAIYFIIFVTIFTTSQFWELDNQNNAEQKNYEVWKVEGKLNSDNVQDYKKERFKISLEPPYHEIQTNGEFSIDILRERNNTTGRMEFPNLYISDRDGDYMGRTINLEQSGWDTTNYNIEQIDSSHILKIKNPIDMLRTFGGR